MCLPGQLPARRGARVGREVVYTADVCVCVCVCVRVCSLSPRSCATEITVRVTVTVKLADKTQQAAVEKCSCPIIFMCMRGQTCLCIFMQMCVRVLRKEREGRLNLIND